MTPPSGQSDRNAADSPDTLLSVSDAAEVLGISSSAVLKRISRGQLAATKQRGQWLVILDRTAEPESERTDRTRPIGQPDTPAVSEAAQQQLATIRDAWLMPLVERIGELERENGRLIERIERLESLRTSRESENEETSTAGENDAQRPAGRRWWRFWG